MKVTEIQSHNVSQRIVVPFPIYWSQDDTVGVATDKGIQIMEILFNPNNKTKAIGCNRYYVEINDNTPTSFVGINTSSLFLKVDTSEAFNLILNQDLVPKLDKAATFQPLVKQIEASPAKGVQCFGRCIFGYVTNSGQLSLIGYKYNHWTEILDLSKLWLMHCKTVCWGPVSQSTKHQISELTYRVAKIKFTSFTWSTLPISEAEYISLLITASQDGIITLWKVFNKTNGAEESNRNVDIGCLTEISASVINCFNSELSFITALSWYGLDSNNGYLIIGNNKGLISYINVSYVNSDILTKKEDIWAIDDKIPITRIICWYYNKGFICVAVKGSFIVISYVDIADNKLLSVCYHNTAMRFITGVEKMEDNSVLVSSRNGDFRLISLQFIDDNITVDENEIGCGFVKQKYALHGFHLSRNKVMGVAVLSVSGPFDHLIIREPSNMLVFSLSEINEPLKLLLYKNEQINNLWDCFEVVRWQILNKVIAYELPGNLHTELDTMELKQLIITMWLTKFLAMASENDEMEEGEGEDGEINKEKSTALMNIFEEIEELVFTSNIFKRCANLITNVMNLSTFDKESLSLIIKWFDHLILSLPESYITTRSSASTLLDEVNDTLNKNTLVLFDFEECCICKSRVPCLTGFKTSRCIRNHALSRCSLCFIQCSYEKIYRCTRCSALAHQNAVTEECENCIFCDNVLRKDNRLLDILDDDTDNEDNKPDTC